MKFVLKVLAAMAVVGGVVYVIVNYGDKIVAWCKKLVGCECACDETCVCEDAPVEEVPVEEVAVAEGEPVAAEADFEA